MSMTLEMIVVISCIILGITIVMVIKQELFPRSRVADENHNAENPPVRY